MWVDKEKSQNFAVTGFSWIGKAEGRDAMLKDVGEGEKPALAGFDAAKSLNCGIFVLDVIKPFDADVVVLET